MSTNPAEPVLVEAASSIRRPGRALIGWMTPEAGAIALAGGDHSGAQRADLLQRVEEARAAVAGRDPGVSQDGIVDDTAPELEAIRLRLSAQPNTEAFRVENWDIA